MAKKRRSDSKGRYKSRVEEADTYKNILSTLPGVGSAMTAAEIEAELKKEEPDYVKVGLLAGSEIIGLIPGLGSAAKTAIRKGANMMRQTEEVVSNIPKVSQTNRDFKNTVKGYKLFSKGEDGKLYPLFVDADTEVPIGVNLKAAFPEYRFKAKNGNFYVPSRGPKGAKGTGDMIQIPDQETRDMLIEAGFLKKGSKAKSIRAVAARPGWHAGDNPTAKHIGPEVKIGDTSYKIRGDNQVWAEVEMPADVDWQAIADSRAVMKKDGTPNVKTAHITDELPFGGYYRYKTNPNMEGNWLISGDMRVLRELDRDEVKKLNQAAGVEDLPTLAELKQKVGFASGGMVGDNMYKGMDDYLMSEMAVGMARGGAVDELNLDDVPDNTRGIDPVSGNEVPIGSLPEEVRDDIPAQLSEGEYVVPADVVRYYGVKFFEDLRAEAKQGFAEMEENGRIGGEPVGMEEDEDLPFDVAELQTVDATDEEVQGMFFGGLVEAIDNALSGKNKKQSNPVATGKETPSIGKQINFPGFEDKNVKQMTAKEKVEAQMQQFLNNRDDDDNTSGMSLTERANRARERRDEPKNNFERLTGAMSDLFGADEQKKSGPKRVKIGGKIDYNIFGSPLERAKRKELGPKYNEGGLEDGEESTTENFSVGMPPVYTKKYVDEEGNVMYVTFAGDTPLSYIPPNYKLATDTPETPESVPAPVTSSGSDDDDKKENKELVEKYQNIMKGPKFKYTDPVESYQKRLSDLTQGGESVAGAMIGGILGSPLGGIGATKLFKSLNDNQLEKLKIEAANRVGEDERFGDIVKGVDAYLNPDEDAKKPGFLSDLLGLEDGDEIGLSEGQTPFSGFQKVAKSIKEGFKDSLNWNDDKWNATYLGDSFRNIQGRDPNRPAWMGSEQESLVGAIRTGNHQVIKHWEMINNAREAQRAYYNNEPYQGNVVLGENTKKQLDDLKASGKDPSGGFRFLSSGSSNNNTNKNTNKNTSSGGNNNNKQSFGQAFAAARKEQGAGGTFTYNGKSYSTNTKEDEEKK